MTKRSGIAERKWKAREKKKRVTEEIDGQKIQREMDMWNELAAALMRSALGRRKS
jgi:hypothetical protein